MLAVLGAGVGAAPGSGSGSDRLKWFATEPIDWVWCRVAAVAAAVWGK